MKKIITIALVVIVGLFFLGLVKDQIAKAVVMSVASNVTGAKIQMRSLSFSIFKQSVRIKDLKIYNPAGFPGGVMADLPNIYVDCDLPALLRAKLHLGIVTVELKELNLVKNKEGKLNVDSLKFAQQSKEAKEKKPAKRQELQIDLLNLNMDRIVLKDYSAEKGPAVEVYEINLKRSYKNITSSEQLTALIMVEPMRAAGIKGAQIYGVSALAGVALLPAAAAITLLGKDSAEKSFEVPFGKLYAVSLKVLKRAGMISKENKAGGVIQAEVSGANVTVKCIKLASRTTQIIISARKYLLPKPEIAGGILYQISEELR